MSIRGTVFVVESSRLAHVGRHANAPALLGTSWLQARGNQAVFTVTPKFLHIFILDLGSTLASVAAVVTCVTAVR